MKQKKWEGLFSVVLLLLLLIISWQTINYFFRQEMIQQQEDYIQKKGQILLNQIQPLLDQSTATANESIAEQIHDFLANDTERITLLNGQGDILYDTHSADLTGNRSNRPEVQAILSGNTRGSSLRQSDTLNEELLYVALPINQHSQRIGILRIAEPTANFAAEAENFRRAILVTLSLAFVLIGGLILYFIRQKNRPLETVVPVLKKILDHPEQSGSILQASNQWEELYHIINQLSEKMSSTYLAYTSTEQQFLTLLNDLMIGVFMIGENEQVKLINPKMREQLAIQEMPEHAHYTELFKDPQLIHLIHQVNQEQPFIHEILTITVPEEQVLDVSLRLILNSDQQTQLLGIAYDLTRIRQLEKVQRDFVGNVSHELKTPVTSLIGFTETLLDGAKDDPATLTEFLLIMQKDAHRLQKLIEEILQLSQDGQHTYQETQTIDLREFLETISKTYKKLIEQKGLTLEIDGKTPALFITQLKFFQPVVKNLIENAVHYSSEQTKIKIRYELNSSCLVFAVTDEGIGIDRDEQERIFERFYRVDKDRSRHSGGTGLGLAIVNEYTKILGGSITVESHLGVGSTFTVELPVLSLPH